ncbi:transcriptional regulator PpsR [Afifella sp. IM 167]|uniref:transcriptional regulator PpsR n=1 Tax=Afifella sp. IM 167 TaxID=2033586 RepID=UPI001CCD6E2D|nr:transcriptional regulator PpsR [Afifella sp. IM 167]MBZ8132702.1 transcriptional regulator PpsR [Afifella sp. IM 167]
MTILKHANQSLKLTHVDAAAAAALLSAISDLAIVVDRDDVIVDLTHNLDRRLAESIAHWRNRPIAEVVRRTSRPVLREMLGAARNGRVASHYSVQHSLDAGATLPIQYAAARMSDEDRVVLVGRDLRPMTELQSQLLAHQQSLDANATSLRKAEAHYRLLFDTASDAIVTIDAATGRIREANPRAAGLLGQPGEDLEGSRLSSFFRRAERRRMTALLAQVLASGRPVSATADSMGGECLALSAELFRAGDLRLVMVRLSPARETADEADLALVSLVRGAVEAVLLTDETGRILWANDSFLALSGIASAALAVGRPVHDFFGWSPLQKEVLLQNIRGHGRIEHFAATIRMGHGLGRGVDLSAVFIADGTPPGYGFVMRALSAESSATAEESGIERAAEGMIDMIGRVPLKDLVRETTDVIEKMCIETALQLSGNNRTVAARVLGLSRQALYAKLNRFGIVAPDGAPDIEAASPNGEAREGGA